MNDKIVSKGLWENGELTKCERISQVNETSIDLALFDDSEDIALKNKKSKYSNSKRSPVTSIAEALKMHETVKTTKKKTVKFIA